MANSYLLVFLIITTSILIMGIVVILRFFEVILVNINGIFIINPESVIEGDLEYFYKAKIKAFFFLQFMTQRRKENWCF